MKTENNIVFYKWWTTIILTVGAVFAGSYFFNLHTFVYENDSTFISFGIAGLFLLTTASVGWQSYKVQSGTKLSDEDTMSQWFIADALMSIGMVGTLLGFLIVLTSAFQNVDTSDAQAMQAVIGQLAAGMGTALLTSLVGLITSTILKFQLVILETANEKV